MGHLRADKYMEVFQIALMKCDLMDMVFDGRWYAWERRKFEENNI